MVRRSIILLICLGVLGTLNLGGPAISRGVSDRAEEDLRRTRLEMRDSQGRTYRPGSFLFAGPSGAKRSTAPRRFTVDEVSGLPASRLPLIGGWFRQPLVPPPDVRGAPVYMIGDEMAVDLRNLSPSELEVAESAALQRRVFIISRTRRTVVSIRPFFRPEEFGAAPAPDFSGEPVGEAFVNGDALVIAPLNRNFSGTAPW